MDYSQHRDIGSLGAQIGIAQSGKDGRQYIKSIDRTLAVLYT
jgi:hypothetical protein